MSYEDKDIVESAERTEALKQETQRLKINARNNTIQIVSLIGAITVGLICIFSSCFNSCAVTEASKIEEKRLAKEKWEHCIEQYDIANCWQIPYQECINNSNGTYDAWWKCNNLVPQEYRNSNKEP